MSNNEYRFTKDFWEKDHFENFKKISELFNSQKDESKFLEIGTYEGRTSTWLLDNIPNCNMTLVDPDPGPYFHYNFRWWFNSKHLRWIEKYSYEALVNERGNQYDLIYIDGDHNASGVLEDAILSWRLLKIGGILLFDDYLMKIDNPWFYIMHAEFQTHKEDGLTFQHPKEAINTFLEIFKGQYELIINNYQIGIKKKVELCKKNLNHGIEQENDNE